jgi:exonuclease III
VRLISWNVNKRVGALPQQLEALAEYGPDVLALQEITQRTAILFLEALPAIGLCHVAVSLPNGIRLTPERRLRAGVLTASRWPLRPLVRGHVRAPWPERVLSVVVHTPIRDVEVHNVYIPNVSTGPAVGYPLLKVETFEALFARLTRRARRPRVLCGDFNAPLEERPDGTIVPFGRAGRDAVAELSIFRGLARFGLPDVYRALHAYARQEFSWYGQVRGYRLDHIFASRSLNPIACEYLHDLRAAGLSDHAPIHARFDP